MINGKCYCYYGGHGKVSTITDCSHKHLTSRAHLERKHKMLGSKLGQTEGMRNIIYATG